MWAMKHSVKRNLAASVAEVPLLTLKPAQDVRQLNGQDVQEEATVGRHNNTLSTRRRKLAQCEDTLHRRVNSRSNRSLASHRRNR